MSSPKGQAVKDKGNAAFKAGDFPTAVGHYSAAIVADPANPTYPLNRAAAYLKLGKNEDAERDCDRVLTLDKKSVKAMFRRGQARVGLRRLAEAKDDFERVLAIDPANGAAKAELEKIERAFEMAARTQSVPKQKREPADIPVPPLASSSSAPATPQKPKRRRVPIEIVDPPAPSTSKTASVTTAKPTDDLMTPVSSRPLQHLLEAKERGQRRGRASEVDFRPNGKHTIVGRRLRVLLRRCPPPLRITKPRLRRDCAARKANGVLRKPKTLFDFRGSGRSGRRRRIGGLVNEVSPTALPSLFQSSLEAQLLTGIVDALRDVLEAHPDEETRGRVREYVVNLARVPRFSTVVLFMSADEKKSQSKSGSCSEERKRRHGESAKDGL
ncbi:uncharacterized protein B0H18DRAFT_1123320 [Fomitopsis serialis]|uniref:uncharacterized protein n=1 Tax=Fomitopsis serialis TaxID=139415 RepID=UPI002008333B|nr:uncharacterized protein B0H18DRAFT_1123320 [Neoantrodia serialis]KAH9917955.1 hypothetical protein B0H18DRAFT_1123320 [Neoantrodia serialis]